MTAPSIDAVSGLVERLRGVYRIPITDGLGPAGGEEPTNASEFVRTFPSPPIQREAADALEAQARELATRDWRIKCLEQTVSTSASRIAALEDAVRETRGALAKIAEHPESHSSRTRSYGVGLGLLQRQEHCPHRPLERRAPVMVFIDSFSSLDDLKGKDRRDPVAILRVLAKVGRFSCFEVDQRMARPMTWLLNKSGWVTTRLDEIVPDPDGFGSTKQSTYPWTYCEVTPLGKLALAGLVSGEPHDR